MKNKAKYNKNTEKQKQRTVLALLMTNTNVAIFRKRIFETDTQTTPLTSLHQTKPKHTTLLYRYKEGKRKAGAKAAAITT